MKHPRANAFETPTAATEVGNHCMLDEGPIFASEAECSLNAVNEPDKAARHKALITPLAHSENLVRQLIAQMKGNPIPLLPTEGAPYGQ